MAIAYPEFSLLYERWSTQVYRCCLLLTMEPKGAEEAMLRTFLQVGEKKTVYPNQQMERLALFHWAIRCSEDHFYRRARRKPKRETLASLVPFPVDNGLWELLQRPLKEKAAFYLVECLGSSAEEAGRTLGISTGRAQRLAAAAGAGRTEERKRSVSSIQLKEETKQQLADLVYIEFDGRHAALKNRLRRFKSGLDRAAPWLALAVILIGIAAALYTAGLAGPT